jgi:hypothetical protein
VFLLVEQRIYVHCRRTRLYGAARTAEELLNNDGITLIARTGSKQRDPFNNNLTNKLIRSFYKREGVDNYDDDL